MTTLIRNDDTEWYKGWLAGREQNDRIERVAKFWEYTSYYLLALCIILIFLLAYSLSKQYV